MMGSKYKRTTTRQSWNEEAMKQAVMEIISGAMGSVKASKQYGVPQTTLERRVQKVKEGKSILEEAGQKGMEVHILAYKIHLKHTFGLNNFYTVAVIDGYSLLGLGRFKTVFSKDQENELVSHILHMERRLFGFTVSDLRGLAFELAEQNRLTHNFNRETRKAGKCWYYSFLKRNTEISLRTPEATSLARATGFNRVSVAAFFGLLSSELQKHKFTPDRIWNVDETGVSTVPKKKSKIIALRGKKQVGKLSSAERGTLVTAVVAMSATGNYLPLMFIFPRKRENFELLDHAPPGSFAQFHESGWMQKEIFVFWFKKFIEFTNPSAERPVLLLLDGHATHTKSLELILLARAQHVVIICFPPHCTHRMQPLDVALMAPLSAYYSQEVDKWLKQHPGRIVTDRQVAELYGKAYVKAATMQTAMNGFKSTGIFPLDPDVFPDHLFAPSLTTERPVEVVQPVETGDAQRPVAEPQRPIPVNEVAASTSKDSLSTSFTVSPADIVKLPQVEQKHPTKRRKRGKTTVLTSTPYKDELEAVENTRKRTLESKRKKVEEKQTAGKYCKGTKPKITARRLFDEPSSTKKKGTSSSHDLSSEDETDDTSCLYCNELFSTSASHEGWIQCLECKNWAHELCSGAEKNEDYFVCEYCA